MIGCPPSPFSACRLLARNDTPFCSRSEISRCPKAPSSPAESERREEFARFLEYQRRDRPPTCAEETRRRPRELGRELAGRSARRAGRSVPWAQLLWPAARRVPRASLLGRPPAWARGNRCCELNSYTLRVGNPAAALRIGRIF